MKRAMIGVGFVAVLVVTTIIVLGNRPDVDAKPQAPVLPSPEVHQPVTDSPDSADPEPVPPVAPLETTSASLPGPPSQPDEVPASPVSPPQQPEPVQPAPPPVEDACTAVAPDVIISFGEIVKIKGTKPEKLTPEQKKTLKLFDKFYLRKYLN